MVMKINELINSLMAIQETVPVDEIFVRDLEGSDFNIKSVSYDDIGGIVLLEIDAIEQYQEDDE